MTWGSAARWAVPIWAVACAGLLGLAYWTGLQVEIGWHEFWRRGTLVVVMAYPLTVIAVSRGSDLLDSNVRLYDRVRNRKR